MRYQDIARPSAPALHRLLPPRTTFRQRLDRAPPAHTVQQVLNALADGSESESESEARAVVSDAGDGTYMVVARRDTWSRAARRRKKAQLLRAPDTGPEVGIGTETGAGEEMAAALVVHVWVEEEEEERAGKSGVQLVVQWKRGHDVQVFESFASHVARKTREAMVPSSASHTLST